MFLDIIDYKFAMMLMSGFLADILEYVTCESYFSHFLNIFKSVYDKSFPVIIV